MRLWLPIAVAFFYSNLVECRPLTLLNTTKNMTSPSTVPTDFTFTSKNVPLNVLLSVRYLKMYFSVYEKKVYVT